MDTLDDYIARTGTEDEFVFSLIKYRLENKTKLTQEQISHYMQLSYATAAKARKERQEKEIKHEKEDSIKDEVGDELKNKTEAEKQEEQEEQDSVSNR